jgi:transposase
VRFERETSLPFLRSAAQALQAENARLRAKYAALLAEREKAATALREKAGLETRLQEAEAELAKVKQENQVLKEQLDLRVQALYGRKSERRPVGEPDPGFQTPEADGTGVAPVGDGANEPASGAGGSEQKTQEHARKKTRKAQSGHGPTPQPLLPREVVTNQLAGDALNCEHCGHTLEPLGNEAEEAELIAIEQRRIVLEQHLRAKYRCPCCHIGVVTAPGPAKLIAGGRYALNFAVEVAWMKYFAHLPLERQRQMMRHEGLLVTTATLFDQIDALATCLAPTYQAIWKFLQAEPVLRADETPWAVLSNGYTENDRFYAWCAVGAQYVGYQLLDTRSKDGAAAILGSFAGTLMVDGLTSYPAAAKAGPGAEPRFKVANCMAHARRKFVECEAHAPAESQFALKLFQDLYQIEREGKKPGADLGRLRDQKSRPLVDQLFTWAKEQQRRADILPSSNLAKALAYLLNHEQGLRVFLDEPAVEIDNNASERAMRSPVLGRKNHHGSRSHRGTEVAAILYTLVESAKRVGVPPKAYLEAAAEHALRKAGAILLPDEFKAQLDAAAQGVKEYANSS